MQSLSNPPAYVDGLIGAGLGPLGCVLQCHSQPPVKNGGT